jgi:hypothetical protein
LFTPEVEFPDYDVQKGQYLYFESEEEQMINDYLVQIGYEDNNKLVKMANGIRNTNTIVISGVVGFEMYGDVTTQTVEKTVNSVILRNNGDYYLENVIFFDKLPVVGDKYISTGSQRRSSWDASLLEVKVERLFYNGNFNNNPTVQQVPASDYKIYYTATPMADLVVGYGYVNWRLDNLFGTYGTFFDWKETVAELSGSPTAYMVVMRPAKYYEDPGEEECEEVNGEQVCRSGIKAVGYSLSRYYDLRIQVSLGAPAEEEARIFFAEELMNEGRERIAGKAAYNNVAVAFRAYNPFEPMGTRVPFNTMEVPAVRMNMSFNSIGNRVWLDGNGNHVQDRDEDGKELESGLEGVEVRLLAADSNGVVTNLTPVKVATTDSEGKYFFDLAAAGWYRVEFVLPSDYSSSKYSFVRSFVGGDMTADSNVETLSINQGTVLSGRSDVFYIDNLWLDNSVDAGIYAPIANLKITQSVPSGIYDVNDEFKFTLEKVELVGEVYVNDFNFGPKTFYLRDNESALFEDLDFGYYRLTEYLGNGYVLVGVKNAVRIGTSNVMIIDLTPDNANVEYGQLDAEVMNRWGLEFVELSGVDEPRSSEGIDEIWGGEELLILREGDVFRSLNWDVKREVETSRAVVVESPFSEVKGSWSLLNLLVVIVTLGGGGYVVREIVVENGKKRKGEHGDER